MAGNYWVISQFFAEESGTGFSVTRLAEGLASHVPVSVICGMPNYVDPNKTAPMKETRNGVRILRCKASILNNNLLFKFLNMVTISFNMFLKVLFHVKPNDNVIIVNLPPLPPFLVSLACRIKGARRYLLVHDVYPQVLVTAGLIAPDSFLVSPLEKAFRKLYRSVDEIIVLGRDMKDLIAGKLGEVDCPIRVIPNSADLENLYPKPISENSLLKRLGIEDAFVITYSGHMGRTHGLEVLFEAAMKLRDRRDIHFLMIGKGPKKQWLEQRVAEERLENMTVLDFRPRGELLDSMNACHAGIISFLPKMSGVSVPGRMYDLMAVGKPIVAVVDSDSELARVIREESIGWVVPPGDPDKLVETLLKARQSPGVIEQMGLRSRETAERKYSLNAKINGYLEMLPASANPVAPARASGTNNLAWRRDLL